MDSISPLAKILAEANGIDWRSIQGSGDGGSIVEQDILNYLSRIMSGDEEPPATPVDETPAGWTGEMPPMPAAVAASGLQALSAAGVESDITDFVAQQQTGPVSSPVPGADVPSVDVHGATMPSAPSAEVSAEATPEPMAAPTPVASIPTPVTNIPAPVAIIAPVPEDQGAASQGHPAAGHGLDLEDGPEAADADMEFELDDDSLDDELQGDGADADAEEAPAAVAGSVQTGFQAESVHAEPAAPVAATLPAFESVEPVPEPGSEPVAAQAQPEEVHGQTGHGVAAHQSPAYDTAPLDEEADFVLADSFPVPAPVQGLTNGQPEGSSHPAADATPAPQEQEAAATTSGFGLGGFLSRLYGNKAETAPVIPAAVEPEPVQPEPVRPEPVEPEPVQAEAAIGSAHPEHEVAPVQASVPEAERPAPDDFELGEPDFSEPVLGEPLIPQAPPIPDTPVAAPLVADQWRDQETASEQPSYALEHDLPAAVAAPFEPSPDAQADTNDTDTNDADTNDAEPDVQEAQQPHDVRPEPESVVHEAPALPEAHEGGLGSELDSAAVALGAAGLGAAGLGRAGLGVAGLAAQAHHEPPQTADAAPEVHAEAAPEAPAEPYAEAHAEPAVAEQPAPVAPAPSSSSAVTLRLNVDLGVLEAARAQLSEALYRDVPVALLVARAAARSLSTLGLSNSGLGNPGLGNSNLGTAGGVALSDHSGQPLAADLSGDFRASLSGLSEVSHGTPALLVIDASGLGLDELHRGECSLSVGRTVGEGTALSLRGEVDPARGAQFLHEVAGLLGTPIRLLF